MNKNYANPMRGYNKSKDFSIMVGWIGGVDFFGFLAKS